MKCTSFSTHMTTPLAVTGDYRSRPLTILLALLVLLLLDASAPGATMAQAPGMCALLPPGASEARPFPPETPGCIAGYPTGKIWESGAEVRVGVSIALLPTAEMARASLPDCAKWGKSCTPTDVGDVGFEIDMSTSYEWNANAVRGCYAFGVGVQYGAPAQSWANGIVVPATGDRALVDQARKLFRQIDDTLKSVPLCPGAAQPPAGRFGVGHGCSYNPLAKTGDYREPAISPGQLRCAATYTNEPPGAVIAYKWTLDGRVQPETGDTFTRKDDLLTAGEHTLVVRAVDTRSNAESESSTFQFTKPGEPPAPKPAGEFTVKLKFCNYDSKAAIETVECVAEVANPPDGADITYEWDWDGKRRGETGPSLTVTLPMPVTFGSHTVRVRATDRISGKHTGMAQTTVQVGSPPPQGQDALIDMVTDAAISQLMPGGSANVTLSPAGSGGQNKAEVKARCEKLAYQTALFVMVFDEELNWMMLYTGVSPAQAILTSVALKCGELLSAQPLAMAMSGDTSLILSDALAPADLPAQFKLEMLRGPIRIEVVNDKTLFTVETASGVVTSEGKNTFGVAMDPKTGDTVVRAYQGTVNVESWNEGASPITLATDQQVKMTESGIGEPGPFSAEGGGAPVPITGAKGSASDLAPTAAPAVPALALPAGVPVWLGASVCLLLLVVLGVVVGVVLMGGKRRRVPVPVPGANWAPAQPVPPGYPSPVPSARLVASYGTASHTWVDLPPTGIVIGRNKDCGLVLADRQASRYHARIECVQGRWFITDLKTSNGTGVNGRRITSQPLSPGDQIQIGATVLRFEQG